MDTNYFYKTLTLYEEEPYLTNSLSEMMNKGWQLISKKKLKRSFSDKIILKCRFKKKKYNNWESEFEISYHFIRIENGQKVVNRNTIILEAKSSDEASEIACLEFNNVLGFKIDQIKKLWCH
tara:strand:+ start:155 stop:520 length:366 start_codon:yes stop_codon:yes gene_type:complete